jgi:uncharacterized protein (TIGR02231 family)
MKPMTTLFLLATVSTSLISAAQDTARADAPLSHATVYFGYGAELTHNANVAVSKNTRQIIISRLSTSIDIHSVQIGLPEHTALLSQYFTIYQPPASSPLNPDLKKWQDSIKLYQRQQSQNKNLVQIQQETLDKTNRLIELAMTKASNNNISSAEALKLVAANTEKIEKARLAIFALNEAGEVLKEKITTMQEKINEMQQKPADAPKPYGQLVLQVICGSNGEVPVTLSYFTKNAGFTPLYDVRVNSKNNEIRLLYKAAITQSTGIGWKKTKLTLSTANPAAGGNAPLLTPWYLQQYVQPLYKQLQPAAGNYMYQNTIQSMAANDKELQEEVVTTGYGNAAIKRKNITVATVDPSTLQQFTTLSENQLNTNYDIDLPYDIESNGQVHSVNIKEEKINALLKNYAVPKLDRNTWLLAEITDWQKLDLLPGIANIIMDNTYIGQSMIDPNSTADTLNLSLGKDRRVVVNRSVVKDFTSTKTSGSFTRQTFTYELTVKNNKITDVDLLLKDQFPISRMKDVEVKLEDAGGAILNEDNAVLTWKLALKPGESKKIRYTWWVKYPKEIRIANL